ncbi:MAG: lysoplasmalogenase [Clostridiales bacterium]|nr:lysoplasmalogenase [Clostridiales bacterium]
MVYLILMFVAIAIEFFTVPLYVKKCWPKKNKTSLKIKMVCSALFIATAVFAILYSQNFGIYSKLMLSGFVMSFIGDFFLHVNSKKSSFIFGITAFFLAHIFYIGAYSVYMEKNFGKGIFVWWQILIILVLCLIALFVGYKKKLQLGKLVVPACLYGIALATMLVKAISLGAMALSDGFVMPLVLLGLGAISFTLSDSTLIFIYFGNSKGYKIKFFNSVTYFVAQILLATSIIYLK